MPDAAPSRTRDGAYTCEIRSEQAVSEAVVAAVASVSGRDPFRLGDADSALTMDPLYDAVDPDALDAFFDPDQARADATRTAVSFTTNDHRVTIVNDGLVTIEPPEKTADSP